MAVSSGGQVPSGASLGLQSTDSLEQSMATDSDSGTPYASASPMVEPDSVAMAGPDTYHPGKSLPRDTRPLRRQSS